MKNVSLFIVKLLVNLKLLNCFHNEIYKQTQAIGGRTIGTNSRGEEIEILVVSSVWHRMLPINNNQYLEIVHRISWRSQSLETQSSRESTTTLHSKPKKKTTDLLGTRT